MKTKYEYLLQNDLGLFYHSNGWMIDYRLATRWTNINNIKEYFKNSKIRGRIIQRTIKIDETIDYVGHI